jgi:hypothetical protein
MTRKKRVKPEQGQLFAAKLMDGSYGLAQVAHINYLKSGYFMTSAFFKERAESIEELVAKLPEADLSHPIAVYSLSDDPVRNGIWDPIGRASVDYANVDFVSRLSAVGWMDRMQIPGRWFLDAYHGLYPWVPDDEDALLLPGYSRPSAARYVYEFPDDFLREMGYDDEVIREIRATSATNPAKAYQAVEQRKAKSPTPTTQTVEHWVYFSDGAVPKAFTANARAAGFKIGAPSQSEGKTGVRLTRAEPKSVSSVLAAERELSALAKEHGAEYGGWEVVADVFPTTRRKDA